jgi:hypothetical protein
MAVHTQGTSPTGLVRMSTMENVTMDLFEVLGDAARPAAIRQALLDLAEQDEVERGAVFTRPEIVETLLDLAGYDPALPLHLKRFLEPSFGGGDFLLPAVERLLRSFGAHGGKAEDLLDLSPAIRGIEIHPHSFDSTARSIRKRLQEAGASLDQVERLISEWLIRDDFLLAPIPGTFEFVIGNPPYVRQERIAEPLLREYRRRYSTIWDRADLYIPFYERGLRLLSENGTLAYICANRWIKNRYGSKLRDLIADSYHLKYYVDLEGGDAFQSEVSAYPCITVIQSGRSPWTKVASNPEISWDSLQSLVRGLLESEPATSVDSRIEHIENAITPRAPWILHSSRHSHLVRSLEERFPSLEEASCRVGIGVATGADGVFVAPFDSLPVEPCRKLRLAMAADIQEGTVRWSGKGVVNPFEEDGRLADFGTYPDFGSYLVGHRERISSRHCAKKSPNGWYRTIDRIWPSLLSTPKLLIPDIKGGAAIGYDCGEYYPHHNLYWITSEEWDLRALATVLRSSLALLFVATYCTKMAGGFLRFQAQYLRRIRVPRWDTVTAPRRTALLAASPESRPECDEATFSAFGFSADECRRIQKFAESLSAKRERTSR